MAEFKKKLSFISINEFPFMDNGMESQGGCSISLGLYILCIISVYSPPYVINNSICEVQYEIINHLLIALFISLCPQGASSIWYVKHRDGAGGTWCPPASACTSLQSSWASLFGFWDNRADSDDREHKDGVANCWDCSTSIACSSISVSLWDA